MARRQTVHRSDDAGERPGARDPNDASAAFHALLHRRRVNAVGLRVTEVALACQRADGLRHGDAQRHGDG